MHITSVSWLKQGGIKNIDMICRLGVGIKFTSQIFSDDILPFKILNIFGMIEDNKYVNITCSRAFLMLCVQAYIVLATTDR